MKRNRFLYGFIMLLMGIVLMGNSAEASEYVQITAKCKEAGRASLEIYVLDDVVDGFNIYRADEQNGTYQLIDSVSTYDLSGTGYYDYDNNVSVDYIYTDATDLQLYHTYYYRIEVYSQEGDDQNVLEMVDTEVMIVGQGTTISKAKRKGKNGVTLSWNAVSDADGYQIYCVSDYDDQNNELYVNPYDESSYTLIGTVSKNTTSKNFSKLINGATYYYIVYAYRNVDGNRYLSVPSEYKYVTMDYYGCDKESYVARVKRAYGSEKKMKKNFKTEKKARKQMKTIKIKVWDYRKGKKGKKVTKTKYLTVNKRLAPTIQQIFKEIYNNKEKQVIHDIGCYSYRAGEHMYGLAIDVNANENYMIDGKKVLAGSYWKPKKDPYSIPNNSQFVKIMKRYGFYRGAWGKRKDYMHFSYFGT